MMYKVTWAFPAEETLFDGVVIKPTHSCIVFKNKDWAYKLWRELPRTAALTKISHEEAAAIERERERERAEREKEATKRGVAPPFPIEPGTA